MINKYKKEQLLAGIPLVTMDDTHIVLNQMKEYICKITNEKGKGTGFFCQIPNKNINLLITCNHVIDEEIIKKNNYIEITLNNDNEKRKIKLNDNRKIYTNKKYDTTIIEIKKKDKISKYIDLDEDIFDDYIQNKCNKNIYIIQYPQMLNSEQKAAVSYGILKGIQNEYEIQHKCSTKDGSSGSPIIELSNKKVIGIHLKSKLNFNVGTYLKYPIEEYLNDIHIIKNKNENNEIKITLKIDNNDINKDIYFLDNTNGKIRFGPKEVEHYHDNLKELNEMNTKLNINDVPKKYSKYFTPKEEGIYEIKLKINIKIKDCSFMFYNCKNIIKLDLSSLETDNVTNMSYMFYGCSKITDLNLSSFDTENVKDMCSMFFGCNNLINLDVSSFYTKKVSNMSYMFCGCSKITDLDLSSFNTQDVINMSCMFALCTNIKYLDLSSFDDTKSNTDVSGVFYGSNNPIIKIKLDSSCKVNFMFHFVAHTYFLFRGKRLRTIPV